LVFSTKGRKPLIDGDVDSRLYEYMGGIVRSLKAKLLCINGMPDHAHLLIRQSKSVSDQDFIGQLKGDSSRWLNQTFPDREHFAWQAGYGWFSVGPKDVDAAVGYIENQKSHHESVSFQDEFRQFLTKYEVEYDERYVWD